jgi:hypothetical protein
MMVALLPSGGGQSGYRDRCKCVMLRDNNTRTLDWCDDTAWTTRAAGEGAQSEWVVAAFGPCDSPSTLT